MTDVDEGRGVERIEAAFDCFTEGLRWFGRVKCARHDGCANGLVTAERTARRSVRYLRAQRSKKPKLLAAEHTCQIRGKIEGW